MSNTSWKLHAMGACALLLALVACDSGNAQSSTPEPAKVQMSASPAGEKSEWEAPANPSHPETISQGEPVKLADHLVLGGYTVFDFTSPYCGPCRQIAPYLDRLHAARDDVTVVKVDINRPGYRGIDFRSPVARQYQLQQVPYFKIYDPDGTHIAEGEPAWKLVVSWIMELENPTGR